MKPTAPPPPPSPPRRTFHPAPHGPAIEGDREELSTASYADPPTMAAARGRVHALARELPSQYDDTPRFDDITQARQVEGELIAASRYGDPIGEPLNAPYDSLPSLEAKQPFDDYDSFDSRLTQDPETLLHAAQRQESGPEYRDAYRSAEASQEYGELAPPQAQRPNTPHARANEGSGPRERPQHAPYYDAAAYEANYPGVHDSYRRREAQHEASYAPPAQREVSYQPPAQHEPSYAPPAQREVSYQPPAQHEPSYAPPAQREVSYQPAQHEASYAPPAQHEVSYAPPPQREVSYPPRAQREVSYQPPAQHVQQDAWAPAPIPAAPLVPQDMKMPAGFVMGVQPIRTPGSVAAAMPQAATQPPPEFFPVVQQPPFQPMRTPAMGVPFGHGPYAPPAQQMHIRPASAHPGTVGHHLQMTEVEEAKQASKVGSFGWFVFGAAFGICFAFFATGFVPRLGNKEEAAFPPAAPIPTQQVQGAVAAPPPVPAPVVTQAAAPVQAPAPVVAPPVVTAVAPPVAAPPVVAVAPPPVATVAAPPAPVPQPAAAPAAAPRPAVAAAPAPRGQRVNASARRYSPAPPSAAPKALPNSGSVDADDAPAPRAAAKPEKSGGGDSSGIGDLLSAGLAP